MSVNVRLFTLFAALVLAAVSLRLIVGAIPAGGETFYAAAKLGPVQGTVAATVEMAASDMPHRRN
jgi:hypothetical protein